jgi:mono/diheme cytochrome c family protein
MVVRRFLLTLCLAAASWGCEKGAAVPTPAKEASKPIANVAPQGSSRPAPKADLETTTGTSSPAEVGKNLYETVCAACHSSDGSGSLMRKSLPGIGDLTDPVLHDRLDDASMANVISQGKGEMPGFGSLLSAEKIQAVVTYIRTLKKMPGKPSAPQ